MPARQQPSCLVSGQNHVTVHNFFLVHVPWTTGTCYVFPNDLQHRVAPFEMADKTKPTAHRKILAFFLVDPNVRIVGTQVAAQR